MKVTVTIKALNPDFKQEIADTHHDGKESEDNFKYSWEDEFEVNGEVNEFLIRNNDSYFLEGMNGNEKFSYEIPSMTIVECLGEDGSITRFAASRKLIKDTKKNIDKNENVHFYLFLKGGQRIANPLQGIYISMKDFPSELPLPEEEEITGDEEE
ncbi:MAG: hypothetical protein HY064_04890 [Bacteroidetes bacterium]|nr:hypothetical protein [Bacteroidota bacterium]